MPRKLTNLAVKSFGKLDGIVINHGLLVPETIDGSTIEGWKHLYDVNVFSCLAMVWVPLGTPPDVTIDRSAGQSWNSRTPQDQGLRRVAILGRGNQAIHGLGRVRFLQGSRQLHLDASRGRRARHYQHHRCPWQSRHGHAGCPSSIRQRHHEQGAIRDLRRGL